MQLDEHFFVSMIDDNTNPLSRLKKSGLESSYGYWNDIFENV